MGKEIIQVENLALFNTEVNEVVSTYLTSDMVDYQLYVKGKINCDYLKVIENPNQDDIEIINSCLVFKEGKKPNFLGLDYDTEGEINI